MTAMMAEYELRHACAHTVAACVDALSAALHYCLALHVHRRYAIDA